MTQEEKDLLMKDLSCRLPYGVICEYGYGNDLELNGIDKPNTITFKCATKSFWITDDLDKCRPYLFPMSSMTEEQEDEFNNLYYRYHESAFIFNERFSYDRYSMKDIGFYPYYLQDWLNSNHFDYRGLIKKGLAIDCTNLNIY